MPKVGNSSVLGFSLIKTQLLTLTMELLIKRGHDLAFWGLFFRTEECVTLVKGSDKKVTHDLWIVSR